MDEPTMSALKARIMYVLALYSTVVLGSSGTWHFLTYGGWSWKISAFGAAAIAMAFLASWLRDLEIEAVIYSVIDGVRQGVTAEIERAKTEPAEIDNG